MAVNDKFRAIIRQRLIDIGVEEGAISYKHRAWISEPKGKTWGGVRKEGAALGYHVYIMPVSSTPNRVIGLTYKYYNVSSAIDIEGSDEQGLYQLVETIQERFDRGQYAVDGAGSVFSILVKGVKEDHDARKKIYRYVIDIEGKMQ